MNLEKINKPLKNLHDPTTVKGLLDKIFISYISQSNKNISSYWILDIIKIILGAILGLSAYYSYFHKEKFPNDIHIIFICTTIYLIFWGVYVLFKNYREKNVIKEYKISNYKDLKDFNIKDYQKYKDSKVIYVILSSHLDIYNYWANKQILVDGKEIYSKSSQLQYNEYFYDTGLLDLNKYTKFIDNL